MFNTTTGIVVGVTLMAVALLLFYGFGLALARDRKAQMYQEPHHTPLETRIEQVLTEARVIIPGGQALLGFQFIATLTKPFEDLPLVFKELHAAGICAVALSIVLLMTPASVHRIAFHGENNETFFRIGSRLVIFGAMPLALGIAINVSTVFYIVTGHSATSLIAGFFSLLLLCGVWFAYPVWLRLNDSLKATRSKL